MQILRYTRRMLAFFGCLSDERIFRFEFLHTFTALIILIILILLEVSSGIYVVKSLQIGDIENSLYGALQVSALILLFGSFGTIMYHKENFRQVIDGFQQISDKCAETHSAIHFMRADRICETFLKYTLLSINIGFVMSSLCIAAIGAIYYFVQDGYVEYQHLFLPLKLSTPFNQNTFHGYAFALFTNFTFVSVYTLLYYTTAIAFMAIGLYFEACTQYFQSNFKDISDSIVVNPTIDMRLKVKRYLNEAINFHSTCKTIFTLSRELFSGTIYFELLIGIVVMTIAIFDVEMASTHLDLSMLVSIISTGGETITVFAYCYIGSLTTDQFFRYGDISYESQWYKLPIDQQKMIQLIIADAQRYRTFHGFHVVDLNLIAYGKMVKAVVSYYMVLKSFTS